MLFPEPFDAPVTLVGVCVQLKVAPAGVLVSASAVAFPEQMLVGPVMVTAGTGLTTKLKESDIGPVHPETMVL
jgi:hypothetical protein